MAWSPLQELVTLDQFKQRLKLSLDTDFEDEDLQLQLEIAHEVCMDFIAQRISGLAAWQSTADGWTIDTVPKRVKGAILAQAVWLYRFRGDDTETPKRPEGSAICPEAAALLMRLRDPALS